MRSAGIPPLEQRARRASGLRSCRRPQKAATTQAFPPPSQSVPRHRSVPCFCKRNSEEPLSLCIRQSSVSFQIFNEPLKSCVHIQQTCSPKDERGTTDGVCCDHAGALSCSHALVPFEKIQPASLYLGQPAKCLVARAVWVFSVALLLCRRAL